MDKRFIDWFKEQDENVQLSVYNFVIYTGATLVWWRRVQLAFEILMGGRYCLWVSRNQERDRDREKHE